MTLTLAEVQRAALSVRTLSAKSADTLLREARETRETRFDIFLSHSFRDRELVIGTKKLIEDKYLSVYVDWIEDGAFDRQAVDRDRAHMLRVRMGQCDALFYAHTPNAKLSRWCPWELGYFDGLHTPERQVYVLPVTGSEPYKGQEYLSLYETVDLNTYRHQRRRPRGVVTNEAARTLYNSLGGRGMPFGRDIF